MMRHIILYENWPGIRRKEEKIDLSEIKWAFHWINEGNLFEQMYHVNGIDTTKYILRKQGGKKLEMPSLPTETYRDWETGYTRKSRYPRASRYPRCNRSARYPRYSGSPRCPRYNWKSGN